MSSTSVRILIADHDNQNDHNTINMLKNEGFTANIAKTAKEARQAIADGDYHLLLVNLELPDQPGMELIHDLTTTNHSSAIIVITEDPSIKTVREAMHLGCRDYLIKPIENNKLIDSVRQVLAREGLIILSEKHLLLVLGRRLRNARQATNITMKELGNKAGISQAQISQIEAGQSAPSLTTLYRLSQALEIRLTDLFINS